MSFKRTTGEVIDLANSSSSSDDEETTNNDNTNRRSSPRLARKRRRTTQQQQENVDSDDDANNGGEVTTISRGSSADNTHNSSLLDNNDDQREAFNSFNEAIARGGVVPSPRMSTNEAIARGLIRPRRRGRQQQQQQQQQTQTSREIIDLQSPSPSPSSQSSVPVAAAASSSSSVAAARGGNNTATNNTRGGSSEKWSCTRCTFENYPWRELCIIRGERASHFGGGAPPSVVAARAAASSRRANRARDTKWPCTRCSYENYLWRELCIICGGERAPHRSAGGRTTAAPPAASARAASARRRFPWESDSDEEEEERYLYSMARRLGFGSRMIHNPFATAQLAAAAASMAAAQLQQQPNIDQMTYQQLLETFGNGSENRNTGASASTISSLPTNTLENPKEELPEDKRTCNICLEDFECGERRKCLPCLHGFHEKCIDQWLGLNGVCPVCKTPVSD